MDNLIENIISYLKYLNTDCALNVSVHFHADIFERLPQNMVLRLLQYNCHTNAYCVIVKSADHRKCVLNQKNLLEKCQKGESFCNTCHAQVHEYIYPVFMKEKAVGFVAVSGYRKEEYIEKGVLNRELWEKFLTIDIPLKKCDVIIPPLSIMLEKMLEKHLKESGNEYNRVSQFLTEYHTNITLADVANHFNRSKSHISHLFKKESKMTIRAFCNDLKLEDARELLLNTDIPVTEIAFDVGFNDTSYFISLFKKKFGKSPLQYRIKNG